MIAIMQRKVPQRHPTQEGLPMEFHVDMTGTQPDLTAIHDAIFPADASVVADLDPSGSTLRISTALGSAELIVLLGRSGYPVDVQQVQQLPSDCCGGCSA